MLTEAKSTDEYYMAQAIALAKKGWYTTHPNPRVGCVLVRDEQIIAQGWHQYAGQGHAEVNALAQIQSGDNAQGATAKGATAYVTLEPCSHFGKTPPCSNALIDAGVKRVVVAMVDPNPLVAGNGINRLQENGIEVSSGVLETEARALNPGFVQRMETQRPRIRCKMAMSLDGRTAMANGESKWITAADAREDVQRLRAESSAILTGIGTVIADDPSMNVRSEKYEGLLKDKSTGNERQPERVILDTQLNMSAQAKMLSLPGQTLILAGREYAAQEKVDELEQQGAQVHLLATQKHSLSLDAVMSVLTQRQYNDVLLEAGATLTGAMLQAGFVDELIIYMAPHLMGSDARGLFNLPGLDSMAERINLSIQDIRAVGRDYRITAAVSQ
ncbi:MAG: bifunctional diaminohydroxyphosphoribosylaminopyrimidine deaminase/5-amino-6-(5-phosphoribosylamino)uracil reductase RibD [gamma proteobacterium symbiont of Lucinoma myriamae]|nr:bifunctional diaminohydroxyphosphoribosylaminopyrimidine deaminase/5-amino-6-(5-phosphoribosylamino)uracil reductase RibD [gamma proteobacterium symbiont of Lucinoma myriamae]MCU7818462.1 bifunctional diaminohydroxyphosphoribosylaminopyrimidine deaminase/5-amino-6-(5-phosphoribosylamino)uracil reductase RibD [gamma proteobacterium symbiont of Lucinoma myriamae]MCU7831764.1 bifunctional diaminohydroxyphosphoribosylaminopyrimidine deaminase/5-amino-6-(5-phosphoribosylamino)uracil reductase RibD 